MDSFVKYFLKNKAFSWLLLLLVFTGGIWAYIHMGKLEDAPFTIKQAVVTTAYPGASASEVQQQVTDILEESIQSLGELYYLKTETVPGFLKLRFIQRKKSGRMKCSSCGINYAGKWLMYRINCRKAPDLLW